MTKTRILKDETRLVNNRQGWHCNRKYETFKRQNKTFEEETGLDNI